MECFEEIAEVFGYSTLERSDNRRSRRKIQPHSFHSLSTVPWRDTNILWVNNVMLITDR